VQPLRQAQAVVAQNLRIADGQPNGWCAGEIAKEGARAGIICSPPCQIGIGSVLNASRGQDDIRVRI